MTQSLDEILRDFDERAPIERASTAPASWYIDPRVGDLERLRQEELVSEAAQLAEEFGLSAREVLHLYVGPARATVPSAWHVVPTRNHADAPAPWVVTAKHVYVRGHGPGGRYKGHYAPQTLAKWARAIRKWRRQGRTVYVYFDNDQKSAAPADARRAAGWPCSSPASA